MPPGSFCQLQQDTIDGCIFTCKSTSSEKHIFPLKFISLHKHQLLPLCASSLVIKITERLPFSITCIEKYNGWTYEI